MLTELQYSKLIASREYLWWDVAEKRRLSLESVVVGILTKGDLDDVKSLFAELGISKVRAIFEKQIRKKRCTYRPPTINYFSLYFPTMHEKILSEDQMTLAERFCPISHNFI